MRPFGTRIFKLETTLLKPAGPSWVMDLSQLVIRDYNGLLRTQCNQSATEDTVT